MAVLAEASGGDLAVAMALCQATDEMINLVGRQNEWVFVV